jgi:hypothetical protein
MEDLIKRINRLTGAKFELQKLPDRRQLRLVQVEPEQMDMTPFLPPYTMSDLLFAAAEIAEMTASYATVDKPVAFPTMTFSKNLFPAMEEKAKEEATT